MTNQTANSNESLHPALTSALESVPQPYIPADFAARVCASLPPQRTPRRVAPTAHIAALPAAAILAIALFLIAPHTAPSFTSLNFDLELLILAQLLAITYWLSARPGFRA